MGFLIIRDLLINENMSIIDITIIFIATIIKLKYAKQLINNIVQWLF